MVSTHESNLGYIGGKHGKQDHVRCIIILLLRALMAIKINIHYENNKAYLNNKMRIIKSS